MLDPFKLLGIKEDATKSEIKQAYYRLAKKFHPDHLPIYDRNLYIENFLNITWAYKVLIDDEKRKEILKLLKEGKIEREIDKLRREARDRTLYEGINLLGKNNVRAEKYLKMAYLMDKENPICKSYYGLVLVYLGKTVEGLDLLEKAQKDAPDCIDTLLNLAEAYVSMNNLRIANSYIKKAMRIDKKNQRIYLLLAKIKRR